MSPSQRLSTISFATFLIGPKVSLHVLGKSLGYSVKNINFKMNNSVSNQTPLDT
jgi:hypothetical protein